MRCSLLVPRGFSRPRRMEPQAASLIWFLFLPRQQPSLSLPRRLTRPSATPPCRSYSAPLPLLPLLLRYRGVRGGRGIFNMELGGVAHLDLSGERKEERGKEEGKRDEGISPDRHRIAPLQARRAGERGRGAASGAAGREGRTRMEASS